MVLYQDWIKLYLHPTTSAAYDCMVRLRYGELCPSWVVWASECRKDEPVGNEINNWLKTQCRGKWLCLDTNKSDNWSIVGFVEKADAFEFNLRFGSGYHPSMGNVN
jgi:hypothetical protein